MSMHIESRNSAFVALITWNGERGRGRLYVFVLLEIILQKKYGSPNGKIGKLEEMNLIWF